MDLKKYDELRNKIHTKDFEGKNKLLDKWLYSLSFLGNIGSIFFASFLVSPAFEKAVSVNLISGVFSVVLSIIVTILILVAFEAIKRILIKNLSFDLVKSKFKILKTRILGWFIFSAVIVVLSFYLSLNGARNFASTSLKNNDVVENQLQIQIDSLTTQYNEKKEIYLTDNKNLREVNVSLRKDIDDTPLNYITARKEYQKNIDKNVELINMNQNKIDQLNNELVSEINQIKLKFNEKKKQNNKNDFRSIILFLFISTSIEILIVVGVYFREYYEYNLYVTNKDRLESVYQRRDRYKVMLRYIYKEGKAQLNERIMASSKLVEIIEENTQIREPKKFVERFLCDMENLGIFVVQGKRRNINLSYDEALNLIENFNDALRLLENLK